MKKAKILAVFGILLAMGLTACNKDSGGEQGSKAGDVTSQEQQQSAGQESQQTSGGESQTSSEHKHSYGEWTRVTEPTCLEKGSEERVCTVCGDKQTRSVNALGHDWGEWAPKTAATCTADGSEERACKRCGEKEERVVKADHNWDAEQDVAAGADPADQVGYKLAVCKNGDAIKAEIKATDAKFYKGKIKSGTPSGYFKLSSTNDKAYWKFTVAGAKMYKGMLYQRGAMDSFSGNTERTYAQTSTSGDHAPKYPLGNFDVKVNGDQLDKSQWIDVPYSELLAEGEDSAAMGDNYSPICLAPIGECVIQAGVNEITYERLGSYNLIISELVFIGAEYEHVHAAASEWSSNDEQHWHACTALGCPTGKLDVANHTFGEWETTKAATCKEAGERQHTCSVCGKVVKEAIEKLAHTLGEPYDVVPATCLAAGSQKKKCSVCEEVVTEVLPKADHNFGDAIVNNAAGEGYIATTGHNCSICEKGALRWSALDYDQTDSSSGLDRQEASGYVRFGSGAVENKGGTEGAGSHIIYKVNVAEAQVKAGLAFKIKNSDGNNGNANVFGPITNDSSIGYVKQADGSFVQSTHRYGLRVNGVEYFLGDNNYGDQSGVTGWFEWPVEFPLQAGVNTIDVFAYQGYRARLMEFELTGLPKFVSTHTHNGGDTWLNDETHHWHKCTAEGCAIADGVYDKAEHDFGAPVVVDATVDAAGSKTYTCATCGKVVVETIPQLALKEWVKEDLAASLPENHGLSSATYADGIVGYKFNNATNAVATFKYTPAAAGTYTLKLLLSPKSGNEAKTGFWKQDDAAKTKITVNGVELEAPATDVDFTQCTVKSSTAKDGSGWNASSMMEPVWFEIANVTLTAGENTIVVSYLTGGYSYFFCGAAIYK